MGLFDILTGGSPKDRFAKAVMARIRASGWTGPMAYDRETFSISVGEGGVQLGDGFLDGQRHGRARKLEVLGELARLALMGAEGPPPAFDEVRDSLLPVIRKRLHVGEAWLVLPDWELGAHRVSHAPIGESLCAWVAIERGVGMKVLGDEDVERWGVGFEAVLAAATRNLRARSPAKFDKDPRGFFTAGYRDHYDVSRLLLPDLLGELPLNGDPVILAPERDTLAVAGSEDAAALDAMGNQLISALRGMQRLLSPEALVWRDGAWRPFPADPASPLGRLALMGKMLDHDWQRGLLVEQLKRQGREAHVGDLRALEAHGLTWSPFGFGMTVLAPAADAYLLAAPAPLVRARADVEAIWGPFAQEPDCWPPRLVIDRAPTDEQWARLRTCAVPAGFEALQKKFAAP